MRPESYEVAWYIRYRWFRCTAPAAGQLLIWAQSESEARDEAAERLGVAREALDVRACPDMEERFRFLCRGSERELATGGPRMRRR